MRGYLLLSVILPLILMSFSQVIFADKGMLKITTEPGDAKIYINGKRKGNSPSKKGQTFTIKLEEGEYRIEVIKATDGAFELYGENNDVFVAEDTLQPITIELKERLSPSFKTELAKKYAGNLPIPKMIKIPAGKFSMGCLSGKYCNPDQLPVHSVTVSSFAMSATEVTFEQWDACVSGGGCNHYPDDEGWTRGDLPVMNVSFYDIQEYLIWLNSRGQGKFQLPSEAQWEYAARAGSVKHYSWGNDIGRNNANCYDCGSLWDRKIAPVASFKPNAFGLYDMHGSVLELTQDCWNDSYSSADSNDQPRLTGNCNLHVTRGSSWGHDAWNLRAAFRNSITRGKRSINSGFRLTQSVTQ